MPTRFADLNCYSAEFSPCKMTIVNKAQKGLKGQAALCIDWNVSG